MQFPCTFKLNQKRQNMSFCSESSLTLTIADLVSIVSIWQEVLPIEQEHWVDMMWENRDWFKEVVEAS